MSGARARFDALFARPVVALAPMEDVTDPVFRALCRGVGAELCFTEFVNVDNLLGGCAASRARLALAPDDQPTAVQVYGGDPQRLADAARAAEAAGAAFVDINCGCWVPRVAARGAGAGWLRDPGAMVAMAKMVVEAVALPVTVKTRIGLGPESHMPIVELARRLEDAGVSALTIHCRTAQMGHTGAADWRWAARARAVVRMPVLVNGDVRSADDAARALAETGCAGVMVGRRAIEHPWVFREARARLERGVSLAPPTAAERLALCRAHLAAAAAARGERAAARVARTHGTGYVRPLPEGPALARRLAACVARREAEDALAEYEAARAAGRRFAPDVDFDARAASVPRRRRGRGADALAREYGGAWEDDEPAR